MWRKNAPNHSTLQWHPNMAPSNGTTSTPPKLVVTLPSGTLQWHPAMAPCNGTTSAPPKLVITLPPTIMAPCNGTTSTPPKLAVTFPPNHSTLQWHTTKAPSNGTTSSAPCNGTLVPRPIRQSGSSPSPPIGSKNPYSYRYLGKNLAIHRTENLVWREKIIPA